MSKILIVDDEEDIYNLIKRYAEREGYETKCASDGSKAIEMCNTNDFDAIVMDIMMPDVDGYTACKEIKKIKDIPVIMLSARGTEFDKLYGFEVGIDDYVVKPFSPKELMARINVIIKRNENKTNEINNKGNIKVDNIEIDTLGRNVYIDKNKIELTAKEYDLLLYLIQNRGIVLTREQIMDAVWNYDYYGNDRTVDWQIKLLRQKLGSCKDKIVTIRKVGYKFEV